jgi:hypothetical protein
MHVEQFLALYTLMGFFGFVETTGVLSVSVLDFVVWDGGLPFSDVGGDGLLVPSWLALCWILGSNLSADTYSSECHHGGRYYKRDLPRGWFPLLPQIISEAPLVCLNGC